VKEELPLKRYAISTKTSSASSVDCDISSEDDDEEEESMHELPLQNVLSIAKVNQKAIRITSNHKVVASNITETMPLPDLSELLP
jgi:hypothetical protein